MSDQDLGKYSEGFANFRRILAAVPEPVRVQVFMNAAAEAASYVSKGLDRTIAADELTDMAIAHGLDDADAVQWIIAKAFEKIDEPDRVPDDIEEPNRKGNGHHQQKQPPALLPLINIRIWQGTEPKPREWLVTERIPARNVTLLTGQGGIGKTLLMQQLAVATVTARDWIGVVPEAGPVLFITAEDDEDELHFRFHRIAQTYETDFNQLADAGLNLISLAGKDSAMAIADVRGIVRPTELFHTMVRTAREIHPRWICLDTAADVFVVNERDRSQVRQCISLLRGIALEINTAVILLAHPSLSGISSGSGLSGSTAWNNSVRSRLYLKSEKKKDKDANEDEQEDEGGARILEFMKSNYSALAAPVKLVWREGLLVPESTLASLPPIDRAALDQRARDVFVDLLRRYNKQDRTVSYKERSRNFAPNEFAAKDEAKALHKSLDQRKRLLRKAQEYLLDKGRIYVGRGPKHEVSSKQNECLYAGGTLL
jgi:RecA-family ATPase